MGNESVNIAWIIVTLTILFGCSRGMKLDESRLLNDLFQDYDVDERPVANASEILTVELALTYQQLLDLDEPTQSLKSLVWLQMAWKDVNLKWNASKYAGHSTIRVNPSRVWTPDLTLYNNVHESGGGLYNFKTKIKITSDGVASWLAPTIIESVCILDISRFPFDTQQCRLKIGSWAHDGLALDLSMKANDPDIRNYKKNTEWKLQSAFGKKNTVIYSCCPAPYHDITYTFNFQRKHLYYIMTIILPCVLLSLLGTISFLFPADSGERVSLVISVLLGLVVFMLIVNDKTPINSDSVPMITQYFNAIGLLTLLTLLATSFVLRVNHTSASQPVSGCLKKFRDFVAFLLCMKKKTCRKPTQVDLNEVLFAHSEHWVSFRDHVLPGPTRRKATEEKILRELQNLSKRSQEYDFANDIKEDWQYTGRVLDKFFFYIFFLAFISISVYVISFM